jgi:Dirigent-like protein
MKRLTWVPAVVVVLGVLAITVTASGSGGRSAKASKTKTIRVTAITTSDHFVDNPPAQGENAPPSPGDIVTFTDKLLSHGRQIGRDQGAFIATGGANVEGTVTAFLPKGHIAVADGFDFEKKLQSLAIAGGTGAYRKARGQVLVQQVSDTKMLLTFKIIL